uniref:C-type lectin domain-containing protein n=1 Tax=Steinernema glaseri TaxID=37863 RepID=A0A1I7ZLT7_9BILA
MYPYKPDTVRLEGWIGGHRVENTTAFDWSDETPWNYEAFKETGSLFDCVELSHTFDGQNAAHPVWTPSYCYHAFNFICKKPIDDYVAMKMNKEQFFRGVYKHFFV